MTVKLPDKNLQLDTDEEINVVLRQSSLILIKNLIIPVLLILVAFFFLYPLFNWGNQGIVIFFGIIVIDVVFIVRNSLVWYWQTLIITNQRVIDIDQPGLLQKIVSESHLNNVTDVHYKSHGIMQILAKIGTIYIKLSDQTIIQVKNIPRPRIIQQLILRLKTENQKHLPNLESLSNDQLVELLKKIRIIIGEKEFAKTILKDFD